MIDELEGLSGEQQQQAALRATELMQAIAEAGDSEPRHEPAFLEEVDEILRQAAHAGMILPPLSDDPDGKGERGRFDAFVTTLCEHSEANALRVLVDELGYCGGAKLTNFHRLENGVRTDVCEAAFSIAVKHASLSAIYALAPGGGADLYHDGLSSFQLAAYDTRGTDQYCANETLAAALVMAGLDPNGYNATGHVTPLGKALIDGHKGRKWYTLALAAIEAGAEATLPYEDRGNQASMIYTLAGRPDSLPLAFFLRAVDAPTAWRTVRHIDQGSESPLWHAVRMGNDRAVALLLKHRADPNERVPPHGREASTFATLGWSLLHMCALEAGSLPILRLLLAAGADVNAAVPTGVARPTTGTPLLFAINAGLGEVARELVERGGADPTAPLNDNQPAEAFISKNGAAVRQALLEATTTVRRHGVQRYGSVDLDVAAVETEVAAAEEETRARSKLLAMAQWSDGVMSRRVSIKRQADCLGLTPNEMMRQVLNDPSAAPAFGLPTFDLPSASAEGEALAGSHISGHAGLGDGLDEPAVEDDDVGDGGNRNFFPDHWQPAGDFGEAIMAFGHSKEEVDELVAKGVWHNAQAQGVGALSNAMVSALFAYTQETQHEVYRRLNAACRGRGERAEADLIKFRPFLYFLSGAWTQLTGVRGTVFRGIDKRFSATVRAKYAVGNVVTWHQLSSCARSARMAAQFLAGYDDQLPWHERMLEGTLFVMEVATGKAIANFSAYPHEEEVLLKYNTFLEVRAIHTTEYAKREVLQRLSRSAGHVRVWEKIGRAPPTGGMELHYHEFEQFLAPRAATDALVYLNDDEWRRFGSRMQRDLSFDHYVVAAGYCFRPLKDCFVDEGVDLSAIDVYELRERGF